jgi:hypothetical protein
MLNMQLHCHVLLTYPNIQVVNLHLQKCNILLEQVTYFPDFFKLLYHNANHFYLLVININFFFLCISENVKPSLNVNDIVLEKVSHSKRKATRIPLSPLNPGMSYKQYNKNP